MNTKPATSVGHIAEPTARCGGRGPIPMQHSAPIAPMIAEAANGTTGPAM